MIRMIYSYVLVAVFMAVFSVSALAAEATSIGTVDLQKLMADSKAGQSLQKQIEVEKDKFLSEISKKEQALRDEEKKIAEGRDSMKKEEFAKKAKEFEGKLGESREQAQTRKKNLETAAAKALAQLRDRVIAAVKAVGDQRGYNLVLAKQNIVIGPDAADITADVLKKLDENTADITLEVSK